MTAAAEVFAARGIATSSINDIAEAAGLTKGAVYSSFASKDDLVLALMEQHVQERLQSAARAFDLAEAVDVGVHDLGASLMLAIHTDADWQHLLFEYCCLARRDPTLAAALVVRRRESRAAVAAVITRIAEAGQVTLSMSAEDVAVTVLALSNGLALEGGIDPTCVPEDLLPRLIALILGQAPPRWGPAR